MRVTLLQTDIRWKEAEANIREADRLMRQAEESDLYVLPEMWSTGFAMEPADGTAQDESRCEALWWMRQTARERQTALSGSLCVRTADGLFRNRHYFIDGRSGAEYHYDKHHLFTYGGEQQHYTAGTERTIVNYGGLRLLLLTCYDLRFPCWSRYATGREYDAIVLVANWPERRQSAWQLLTRARAIENQCYVLACNRVGCDPYTGYAGGSAVIDCHGVTLAHCRRHEVQAVSATLDLAELERRRSKFRVLADRDE